MSRNPSVWMSVLLMTAIIMGVILLAVPQRQAQAVMLNAQAGFSLLTSGNPGGDEYLFVIDKTSKKIVVYSLQGNNLQLMAGANFGNLFPPAGRGR